LWCKKFGLQEADAADATQTVLLKLVQSLQTFDYDSSRGSFRGWLKTVTHHVATDIVRTWRERGSGDNQLFDGLNGVASSSAAESLLSELELAHQQELLRMASERIRIKVKPKTWDAYWKTCQEGASAIDVAKVLNMTVGDVYVAKSRVLKMLRAEVRFLDPDNRVESSFN
jgi:RNA polymerase sigma-70 factor (ECF subfamily)